MSNINDPSLIQAFKDALSKAGESVTKDVTGATGYLVAQTAYQYSLEAPSKQVWPYSVPLLERMPRNKIDPNSRVAEWKSYTAINTAKSWVAIAENATGTQLRTTNVSSSVTLKQLGAYNTVGADAYEYGKGFEDLLATCSLQTMMSLKEMQEDVVFGGNISALSTTGTVTAADVTSGGSLLFNNNYRFKVCALTTEGFRASQASSPAYTGSGATLAGHGIASAEASLTTANDADSDHSITLSWAAISDAVGYVIYMKDNTGGGNYKLHSVVNVNRATITTMPTTGDVTVPSNDGTANANDYNGLVNRLRVSAQATITSKDNAALASDSASGIDAITTALKTQFDSYGIGPDIILVNGAMRKRLIEIVGGSTAPVFRLQGTAGDAKIDAGIGIGTILNPFTDEKIEVVGSRRMIPNTIMGLRFRGPFPYSNLGVSFDMAVAKDYHQINYPMTLTDGRVYPIGVYVLEALRMYAGMGSFLLTNVKETA